MRLLDLEATFVRYESRPHTGDFATMPTRTPEESAAWRDAGYPTERHTVHCEWSVPVDSFAEAQGVRFTCPKCLSHKVSVSFAGRGVPDAFGSQGSDGGPTRWVASGSDLSNLSLSPSVWLQGSGCGWHGFVTNGDAA